MITTTLYDLITAIHASGETGEDEVVVATVAHMLRSGRIAFLGDFKEVTFEA